MSRTFWNAVLTVAIAVLSGPAFAQQAPPAARWINPGATSNNASSNNATNNNAGNHNNSHGGEMRSGSAGGQWVGGTPSGRTHAAPSSSGSPAQFGSAPAGSVTDPGFAGRLGRTVGGYPSSAAPGYGNINHPGIQPLPTGSGFPMPSINSPGDAPGLYGGLPDGRRGRHRQGYSGYGDVYGGQVIYYGVPYYVPVYTEAVPVEPPAPEPPRPFDIRQYEGVIPSPAEPQKVTPAKPARTVTLLAFKDAMVIAVTDYWMQGYSLVYETSLGVRTVIPLDRLDWALTQQLNFERNVPFVLEARP